MLVEALQDLASDELLRIVCQIPLQFNIISSTYSLDTIIVKMKIVLFVLTSLTFLHTAVSLNNGVALTPPMGWLTWERYRCTINCAAYPEQCVSEGLLIRQSKQLVTLGLDKLGYEYIIVDDCWLNSERDSKTGELLPDKNRFPNGIKSLADTIHSMGLKFGIYEDMGSKTCGGYPGSLGFIETDANTFAGWGVDYVKLDGCNMDTKLMDYGYTAMGKALNRTNRPIVYSCSWPYYLRVNNISINYELLKTTCNLWRNDDDVEDSWESIANTIKFESDNQDTWAPLAGPGSWNDPDMIMVGNFGLSKSQAEAQFGMWAIMAAPLILSTDLTEISDENLQIIANSDVIAVNQDPLGIQGRRILTDGAWSVYTKQLATKGDYAVAILNVGVGQGIIADYTLKFNAVNASLTRCIVKNLFSGISETRNSNVTVAVNQNGIVMLRLSKL